MPVDLSQTGLAGIEAADQSAYTQQLRLQALASTKQTNIENEIAARDIALDQEAAMALQRVQSGDVTQDAGALFRGVKEDSSSAVPLEVVADVMLKGGAITRGTELMKVATNIRRDESLNERAKFENAKDRVDTVLKTADAVARTIGVAKNESEWRYGLAQLRKNQVLPEEQLAQLDAMDYDPDVVAYLNEQALTAYQKAQLDLTASRDATNKRQADARIDNAKNLASIAKARLKLAQEAAERAAKTGKSASAPNQDEVKAASAAIISQVFNGKPPTTVEAKAALTAGASSVAARTQALLRENKALDYETALNRAIIESQAAGDWEVDEPGKVAAFFGADTDVKFGKGKTPDTAMPLPENPKKLVRGKFYITARGKAKWNGKGFELISQ